MTTDHPGSLQPTGWVPPWAPHLVNGFIVLTMFVFALATYDSLPERYAIHFNGAGTPDGWANKGWAGWLAMPLVALGMTILMLLCAKLVDAAKKHPGILSIPHKEKFLALPAAAQAPLWQRMKGLLYWTTAPINLILLYVQWSIHRVASCEVGQVTLWPILFLLGLSGLQVIYQTISLMRAVKRAVGQL